MADGNPRVVVIAGPNGAGKSTIAKNTLNGPLAVNEFVNADVIARGLSGLDPDRVAIAAGRAMLQRLNVLADRRESFAFESTLSSRTFLRRITTLTDSGYDFHLVFVWVEGAECCVSRVSARVQLGGHFVPDNDVRRRYLRSIRNFNQLYRPIASSWQLIDNTGNFPTRVASGGLQVETMIRNDDRWSRFESEVRGAN